MEHLGNSQWGTSPTIYFDAYYEYQRDGADMLYRVKVSINTVTGSRYFGYPIYVSVSAEGSERASATMKNASPSQWSSNIEWTSDWFRISGKTTGTTSMSINLYSGMGSSRNYTYYYNLYVAPAYPNITSFTVSKVSETSVKLAYSVDSTCDSVKYSKNNGSTWLNYPTNGVVTGLTAGTSYDFKIKVRRADSQLWSESSKYTQSPYDYPKPTSINNFTIGNSPTIEVSNPLGRTYTLDLISNVDGSNIGTYTGSINGAVAVFNTTAFINQQYASIPNANNGTYYAKVTYSGNTRTKGNATYYTNTSNCSPVFTDFNVADSNSSIVAVTGSDQVFVKGYSTLKVSIPSSKKMTAQKSATPSSYSASCDNLNNTANYSTSNVDISLGTLNSSGNLRVNVRAYDSRNNGTLAYKDITVYDYTKPVINLSASRLNKFENETTLKVSGTYNKLTINGTNKNTITNVKYRYREVGGTWSNWTNINTTVSNGTFTCSDVIISLDNTKTFEFEVQATDNISNNTNTTNVDVGIPIFFISSNNRACYINGKEILQYDVVDTW